MLPDFAVPIVLGEERASLLVRDVEACVFWQGYPDTHAELTGREARRLEAAWFQHLLARVTVEPALTVEWVREMGDDSWPPTQAYLEAVGFFPRPVLEADDAEILRREIAGALHWTPAAQRQRALDFLAFRRRVPPAHVQRLLRLMAPLCGVPASQLWRMPVSEFFFNYHVALSDEQKLTVPLPEVSR